MSRSEFYGLKAKDKKDIFEDISNKTGMPAFAVEKDWWVTETLAVIFEMEVASHLVFKGGTGGIVYEHCATFHSEICH